MKNAFLLFVALFLVASCNKKKEPAANNYDFTIEGAMYAGDPIRFTSNASDKDFSHWYFGNYYYSAFGNYQCWPCDTCEYSSGFASGAFYIDSGNGRVVNHTIYCPGTYNVVLTVNHDTLHKKIRQVTLLSPQVFDTGVTKMRHWSRTVNYYGPGGDTSLAMVDTDFALRVTNGNCTGPGYVSGMYAVGSNSQALYYQYYNHYTGDCYITYRRMVDSVYITGYRIGVGSMQYPNLRFTYTSGH